MSAEYCEHPSVGPFCVPCSAARAAEIVRVERWHATYNAVLPAFASAWAPHVIKHPDAGDKVSLAVHAQAKLQADAAHGELVKP